MFSTALFGAAAAQARACAMVSCSPANRLQRRSGMQPGRSMRSRRAIETTDGTENQWLIRCSATNRTGVSTSSACGTTSVAPEHQATNMSNTDGSKVRSNVCDSRLPGPTPYRSMQCTKYGATLRCRIGTPFGSPVEPDVNRVYATASGASGIGPSQPVRGSDATQAGGSVPAGALVPASSSTAASRPGATTRAACSTPASSTTTASTLDSRQIRSLRPAGNLGFSGTTIAPQRSAARYPTYAARLRAASRPTARGGRPQVSTSRLARRSTRSSSSW
jgi:hypothetical protein